MKNNNLIYLNLLLISAATICFEILSTRISSVIFVNNYAFIILSLAILGLGSGGIYSYYRVKADNIVEINRLLLIFTIIIGITFVIFILSTILFSLTNSFIYFFLLFLPFFFSGIVYALIFKNYAAQSFKLYASDLAGAALGALGSIALFKIFNAPNAIFFITLVVTIVILNFTLNLTNSKKIYALYLVPLILAGLLLVNGETNFVGQIPIGNFPEKDFHHVYNDPQIESEIVDSRWSIYGRSDLVEHSNQNIVKHLFIDGAAGTRMFRFNGNVNNPSPLLYNIVIRSSTTIPLLLLQNHEKDNMLSIGPGGGHDILAGLFSGVKNIKGIEINPDFVNIVEDYSYFNGGIYTNTPNVQIEIKEGRHYIKQTEQKYDLVVMALPSTEQLQSIDNFAANENYLLTVEALQDYLEILTSEGRLILTVHNRWELLRLIITSLKAFENRGIGKQAALEHFLIIGQDYSPTIVIKKKAFSKAEIAHVKDVISKLSENLPAVTYLPYHWEENENNRENSLLRQIKQSPNAIQKYIERNQYDISPVYDDSPYFYKIKKGVPDDYLQLLAGVFLFSLLVIGGPYFAIKKSIQKKRFALLLFPLAIFICLGVGFMILEVSLFQKLVLYLGSPTISLSILLASLLIGMGFGSFFGKRLYPNSLQKRLKGVSFWIIVAGSFTFLFLPYLLDKLLVYGQFIRGIVSFIMLLPLGFLFGIPFPSTIKILQKFKMKKYIPWMYGVNGIMSVLGSILAVVFSMLFGFTAVFFIGLSMYLLIFLMAKIKLVVSH
ncbi:MAG: hypothetical protein K9M80_00695 [Candidatus Marinimicrobia bacterium]|nr:hypothetical protein [Candidatus Neomarinimicrobiota bacterium]